MNKEMISITAAASLRICHLVDEEWTHPECIPGDTPVQTTVVEWNTV